MTLLFVCGHRQAVDVDRVTSPVCGTCGARRVARVLDAPRPTFRGHVSGPYAQRATLPPVAVALAERPLPLKAE